MKNVLISGANGFVGTNLVKKLIEEEIRVTALVRPGNAGNIMGYPNIDIVYCELKEIKQLCDRLKDKMEFDTMYHLAWAGTSGDGRADYDIQCDNIKYTLDIIHLAHSLNIKRFIGAGTLAEYDGLAYIPQDGASPNPVAMYAAAKISAHYMSKIECNRLGIEHVWGVFSNIYGVGNTTNNFVNFAVKLMLSGKRASFTAGEQNYDFVYISDFVKGLYLLGKNGKKNCEYFIGSGKPRKLKEYILSIRNAIDENIELFMGEIPFNGVSLGCDKLSTLKLERDTGYKAEVDFDEGISQTVEWLRKINN